MSEEGQNNDGQPTGDEGKQQFKAPATQEELDRIISTRLERERQKFGDYDDLKAKASKYDEAQEAAKSELEKANERAQAAEARAGKAERDALVARIAAEEDVPAHALHGTDEDSLRQSAQNLKQWRDDAAKHFSSTRATGIRSGASGSNSGAADPKERAAAALRSLGKSSD